VTFTSSPVTDLKHPPESGSRSGSHRAISNTHNVEVARRMRERCTYLVAVGTAPPSAALSPPATWSAPRPPLKRAYLETEAPWTASSRTPRTGKRWRPSPASEKS